MKIKNRLAILSAILWFVFIGIFAVCRYPTEDLIAHSVEATIQARAAESISPKDAILQIPDVNEDPMTAIEIPTPIPETVIEPSGDPSIPCLYAKLIAETIADGTEFKQGQTFTKAWVLENTGSCSWKPNYKLVFTGGEQMSSAMSIKIGQTVAPGDSVFISVDLMHCTDRNPPWKLDA